MPEISSVGKGLLVFGVGLSLLGAVLMFSGKIPWIGRLPGDIRVEKGDFYFYFPLASCLFASVLLSFFIRFFSKN
jgi:hypothetical protein